MSTAVSIKREIKRRMDWPLLLSAMLLLFVGLLTLYSASSVQPNHRDFNKQIIWVFLSVPVFMLFYFMDPRTWCANSRALYVFNLILLLMVFIVGKEGKGAQRWIDLGPLQIQPSEPAKLILILTFADFLVRHKEHLRTPKTLFFSLVHMLIPFLLVFKQPDFGTSLVFLCLWLGMSLVAKQRLRYITGVVIGGVIMLAVAWNMGIIQDYQKQRIEDLIAGRESYHSRVAAYSIGSGLVAGQGFGQGAIKQARIVPEQTTDFIFTVVAEEGGFIGGMLTVAAFAYFLLRVWRVVASAQEPLFKIIATGIYVVFAFHILVNLLMVVHVLPIVGVPLPFMSYGGSAMVLNFAMLGLLLNLRSREKHLIF